MHHTIDGGPGAAALAPRAVPRASTGAGALTRVAAAGAVALAGGLATTLVAPLGVTTAAQGLLVMAGGLAIGAVAGFLGRSRWALPLALVAYGIGVEATRLDPQVASLQVRLDTAYGVIMLVLARGLHLALVAVPMTAGVAIGLAAGRVTGRMPARRGTPWGTAALAIATTALAVLVAWPASTPPVTGPDGRPVPGSVAELATVELGGADHTIMVRAADPTRPVLLYLSGGPGQSDLALARSLSTGWVQDFVVVNLDQRGNGTSYPAILPLGSMTLERAIDDVIELTEYLRDRFDEERVYLVGESWGTILGVLAAERRPDLFHAFIGSGQMVNVLETDRRIYADLVAHATQAGDGDLLAQLQAVGEPPYRDLPWANSNLLAWYDLLYKPYVPSEGSIARSEAAGLDMWGLLGSEYSVVQKATVLRGLVDTFTALYPQLYGVDLRERAARLEVPVWVLDGLAELDGRRSLALEWFAALDAPSKRIVAYENAAHSVAFEQADAVQQLFADEILPATYRR